MVRILISMLGFFCITSCIDQKLYLQNIQNRGVLNIDGVYLCQTDIEDQNEKYCGIIILYGNSLVKRGILLKDKISDNLDESINRFSQLSKESKTSYGIYNITDNDIYIESWSPSSGGSLKTIINRGKIVSNESFEIHYMHSNYGDGGRETNVVYKLHPIRNKPDSANRFIKPMK